MELLKRTCCLSLIVMMLLSNFLISFGVSKDYSLYENYKPANVSKVKTSIGSGTRRQDINNRWLSETPNWVLNKNQVEVLLAILKERHEAGIINQETYDFFNQMILDLKSMVEINVAYLYDQDLIDDDDREYYLKTLAVSHMIDKYYTTLSESGNEFVTYYTLPHIRSLLDLVSYGVIDMSSPLINLSDELSHSEAVIAALGLLKRNAEIENTTFPTLYTDVPEKAQKYVAYAIETGIMARVNEGTPWNDNPLSLDDLNKLIGEVLDKAYVSNSENNKMYFSTPIAYRFGTTLNRYSGIVTLNDGFPTIHADMVYLLSSALLNKPLNDYPGFLIDYLSAQNRLPSEKYRYLQLEKYYLNVSLEHEVYQAASLSELSKFINAFNREHSISNSRFFSSYMTYYNPKVMTEVQATLSFDGKNFSEKEVFDAAITFLIDFGLKPSEANELVVKSRACTTNSMEKPVFKGHDFIISGFYNSGYETLHFSIGTK